MRSGLALRVGAASIGVWLASIPAAGAQVPPTNGELLPGGAEVTAGYHVFDGDQPEVAPSGRNSNVECWYAYEDGASGPGPATLADLQAGLARHGTDQISVVLLCGPAGTGRADNTDAALWPPDGNDDFVVSPDQLAVWAKDQLWYPPPVGDMSPSLATGTVAQLDTYFWVDNWEPVSASASAGPVTATATATPIAQSWTLTDTLRGTTYSFTCQGPGVPFDGSSGAEPPAGACTWKPPHSSAGQGQTHRVSGEDCFAATVTITWDVTWTVEGAAGGGNLGTEPSAASTCIFVDEIQALVTDG